MQPLMRGLVVAIAFGVVALAPRSAAAGRGAVVINTGDEIEHITTLDTPTADGLSKVGYHYWRFGVFWLDLWRYDGEFVLYLDEGYIQLTDDEAARLGVTSVPWRYHLPPGLLIVVALIELALITRTRRRRASLTIAIGVAWLGVAALFYAKGLDIEFGIPALLGLHHIIATWFALGRASADDTAADDTGDTATSDDAANAPAAPAPRHRLEAPPKPSKPLDDDPFRAPPQPQPIDVQRQAVATDAPLVRDESAAKPKLLG